MKNNKRYNIETIAAGTVYGFIATAWIITGCTKVLPSQLQLTQQQENFSATSNQSISTKVDMLWVVDNSSSMDPDQQKLRAGFTAFAQKYMQPTWDIRVAAITTDVYLANSVFSNYLQSTIPLSAGAKDPYIFPLVEASTYLDPTQNAAWNTAEGSVVNLLNGFYNAAGVTINDLVPAWGPNYSKLLPGLHDGPVAGLCSSFTPYFLNGENQCAIRDSRAQTGTADCLTPTGAETSVTQCVNTVQNDTIHSGNAIVSTIPPTGTPGDSTWVTNITNQLIVNLTTGTAGAGSERGLNSVSQLLTDNEATGSATPFFRPGSLRVIIFISDEDDQSMSYSGADEANVNFNMFSHYQCDSAGLTTLNIADAARLPASFCCAGGGCTYGGDGTTCSPKTILNNDGTNYTYTVSTCPNSSLLIPVSTFKTQFDSFFETLDGTTSNPNYFVVTITGLTGNSIQALQTIHNTDDANAGAPVQVTADRADRYISLGNLVGNGSFSSDITASDYTSVLDSIGNEIVLQKGTFTLQYPATSQQEMTVTINHANGTTTSLQNNQYSISGTTLTITDLNLVLTFQPTDSIVINYQPSSSF